ncbi:MAG: molybdopterin-dependent oxidoreductase [Caldilineaceae bacterium]
MNMNRREFLKGAVAAAAMTTATALFPGVVFAEPRQQQASLTADVAWKKAPCRFCGTGCGVLVGVADGRAVAVKGDPDSPVNQGLLCAKGYYSILALYGKDRLATAYVRKNGELVETPITEALDLVAQKMQETIDTNGKDAVAIYGSGQWTIPDGYVASKFLRAGVGTNNIEANARLCMASAVAGFMTTFGLDEPMGCYEDIDHADAFVLWGANSAEMHPVLFSRMLDQRLRRQAQIVDLGTRFTRTSAAADKSVIFKPQTDLALANAIAYEIINNGWVNEQFVNAHCVFKQGKTNIGYGLEDNFAFNDEMSDLTFDEYKLFLEDYAPEKVAELTGVSVQDIRALAQLYGDPERKVMSLWCMGVNQHARGTWMNNLIYNIHLLVGKVAAPGNSPFSLTGQPSACGTVREVGTLTHLLPSGGVAVEAVRARAAELWGVPVEKIPDKPTYHTVEMFRALDRGDIKFIWVQVTNPMVSLPKLTRYREGALKEDRFVVVSDIYPTETTAVADVILPSAMWIEREGLFGNSERRTQQWDKIVDAPGEAMSDTWQIIEVARRMGYGDLFPWTEEEHIEAIWHEYIQFHDNPKHAMAPYSVLKEQPGAIWPFVEGKETQWRYNGEYDPVAAGSDFNFYGKPDGKAWIIARPYEPAAEEPNADYPFWFCTGRVLEHWHTGTMTRRVPILYQAMPRAYVEVHPDDAQELDVRTGDMVRISSLRGSVEMPVMINKRGKPVRGQLFVPFFDESMLINEVTIDAFCPISKEPDYKKCAVKIEKITQA